MLCSWLSTRLGTGAASTWPASAGFEGYGEAVAQQLFVFVQMEFPWVLGPADGRYLMRRLSDGEPEHVIVIGTLDAQRSSAAGRRERGPLARRARRAASVASEPAPEPVATTRVTCIDPVSLAAESQARAWLAELDREREVDTAAAAINRVVHSHRIATADPYVHEVSAAQALVIRAGWGVGEQVADGLWAHAHALPWQPHVRGSRGSRRARSRDRSAALRPQERLAAMLGARSAPLLCEELVLRARSDLDQGRRAHATLELERALALAVAELRAEQRQDLAIRLAELEQLQPGVQAQAQAVLAQAHTAPADGGVAHDPGPPEEDVVTHALERVEAALRARSATGFAQA
jgi:hypothetical protein